MCVECVLSLLQQKSHAMVKLWSNEWVPSLNPLRRMPNSNAPLLFLPRAIHPSNHSSHDRSRTGTTRPPPARPRPGTIWTTTGPPAQVTSNRTSGPDHLLQTQGCIVIELVAIQHVLALNGDLHLASCHGFPRPAMVGFWLGQL